MSYCNACGANHMPGCEILVRLDKIEQLIEVRRSGATAEEEARSACGTPPDPPGAGPATTSEELKGEAYTRHLRDLDETRYRSTEALNTTLAAQLAECRRLAKDNTDKTGCGDPDCCAAAIEAEKARKALVDFLIQPPPAPVARIEAAIALAESVFEDGLDDGKDSSGRRVFRFGAGFSLALDAYEKLRGK